MFAMMPSSMGCSSEVVSGGSLRFVILLSESVGEVDRCVDFEQQVLPQLAPHSRVYIAEPVLVDATILQPQGFRLYCTLPSLLLSPRD